MGTIREVVPVDASEKLVQLTVDFGPLGTRTILAGIKQFYTPEALVGTQAVFVYNLKPRVMAGIESHGMMLMAENEEVELLRPHGRWSKFQRERPLIRKDPIYTDDSKNPRNFEDFFLTISFSYVKRERSSTISKKGNSNESVSKVYLCLV